MSQKSTKSPRKAHESRTKKAGNAAPEVHDLLGPLGAQPLVIQQVLRNTSSLSEKERQKTAEITGAPADRL